MKPPMHLLNCASCIWLLLNLCGVTLAQLTLTTKSQATVLKEQAAAFENELTATCTTTAVNGCRVSIRSMSPNNPCGNCFALYPCNGNSQDFCLRYVPGQGVLNPSITSRYTFGLQAVDGNLNVALTTVDVYIQPNLPPYFPTKFRQPPTTVNFKDNDGTYQVKPVDPEDDALIYSMFTIPATDALIIGSTTGIISATTDLRTVCIPGTTAVVTVTDRYHNEPSAPTYVNINFAQANDRPIINNLNTVLYVREGEKVGETVLKLAAFDGNKEPPVHLKYTLNTVPISAFDLFEIDPVKNLLLVKSELDYESQPREIKLFIRANDGYCDSELYTLTIRLVDINEPPFLFPEDHTLDSCEGLVDLRPNWSNISDPDAGDEVRFTLIETSVKGGLLKIHPETGMVSTTYDYDLDKDKRSSFLVPATVTLSDLQGETATATLTIRFTDCNDNAPTFATASKAYIVRDCWTAGTSVGSVPKTEDIDSALRQNNVFSYSGSGKGVEVQESGNIIITEPFAAGTSVEFAVTATDKGQNPGPLKSKPFYASLYTLPCFVPPPTVDPLDVGSVRNRVRLRIRLRNKANGAADKFFDPDRNLGWVIGAGALAALMLPFLIFMLWKFCLPATVRCWGRMKRGECCKPPEVKITKIPAQTPIRCVTPVRRPTPPPPAKPGPGFIFGWWKEMYPDNDYDREPTRKALPEASKGPELEDTNTYDILPVFPETPRTSVSSKPFVL